MSDAASSQLPIKCGKLQPWLMCRPLWRSDIVADATGRLYFSFEDHRHLGVVKWSSKGTWSSVPNAEWVHSHVPALARCLWEAAGMEGEATAFFVGMAGRHHADSGSWFMLRGIRLRHDTADAFGTTLLERSASFFAPARALLLNELARVLESADISSKVKTEDVMSHVFKGPEHVGVPYCPVALAMMLSTTLRMQDGHVWGAKFAEGVEAAPGRLPAPECGPSGVVAYTARRAFSLDDVEKMEGDDDKEKLLLLFSTSDLRTSGVCWVKGKTDLELHAALSDVAARKGGAVHSPFGPLGGDSSSVKPVYYLQGLTIPSSGNWQPMKLLQWRARGLMFGAKAPFRKALVQPFEADSTAHLRYWDFLQMLFPGCRSSRVPFPSLSPMVPAWAGVVAASRGGVFEVAQSRRSVQLLKIDSSGKPCVQPLRELVASRFWVKGVRFSVTALTDATAPAAVKRARPDGASPLDFDVHNDWKQNHNPAKMHRRDYHLLEKDFRSDAVEQGEVPVFYSKPEDMHRGIVTGECDRYHAHENAFQMKTRPLTEVHQGRMPPAGESGNVWTVKMVSSVVYPPGRPKEFAVDEVAILNELFIPGKTIWQVFHGRETKLTWTFALAFVKHTSGQTVYPVWWQYRELAWMILFQGDSHVYHQYEQGLGAPRWSTSRSVYQGFEVWSPHIVVGSNIVRAILVMNIGIGHAKLSNSVKQFALGLLDLAIRGKFRNALPASGKGPRFLLPEPIDAVATPADLPKEMKLVEIVDGRSCRNVPDIPLVEPQSGSMKEPVFRDTTKVLARFPWGCDTHHFEPLWAVPFIR